METMKKRWDPPDLASAKELNNRRSHGPCKQTHLAFLSWLWHMLIKQLVIETETC